MNVKMKNHSVFIRLLSAFIIFIILPLFIVGISFVRYSKQYITKDFIEKEEIKSNNLRELSTSLINRLGTDTIRLSQNNAFKNYRRMTVPGEHFEETYAILELFQEFTAKHDVLKSVYFYDADAGIVFSSLSGVQNVDDFPDTGWYESVTKELPLNQLHLRMDINDDYPGHAMYSPEYVLTWISAAHSGKYLITNISCSKLSKTLAESIGGDSSFILASQEGIILLSDQLNWIGQDYEQTKQQFLSHALILTKEGTGYLNTFLIADISILEGAICYMNLFVYLVCGTLVLVFILVAYFTARKIYSPINDIMETLAHTSPDEIIGSDLGQIKDELALFHSALHSLTNQRQELITMVGSYEFTVRNTVFSNYIQGYLTYPEFTEKAALLGFTFTDCSYQIFLFSPLNDSKGKELLQTYDERISKDNQGLCFQLTKDIYALIQFRYATPDSPEPSDIHWSGYETELLKHYVIATCSSETSVEFMPIVYQKALFALNHAIYYELSSDIVKYEDILNAEMNDTDLPEQYLQMIVQAIALKSNDKLEKTLADLFQFLTLHKLNYQKCRNALVQFLCSLQKILHLEHIDLVDEFYGKRTLKEVRMFFYEICVSEIKDRKKKTSTVQDICFEIKKYIDTHYQENINLVNLAKPLQISYPYLSKVFKENEKCTLIDYLNTVRIQNSKDLLLNSNLTLAAIAEQVGYNNVQSYQRFFKKLEGITPNTFRQLKTDHLREIKK